MSVKMPDDLVCVDDFEKHAETVLPKGYWNYYSGGTFPKISLNESKQAFKRYMFRCYAKMRIFDSKL